MGLNFNVEKVNTLKGHRDSVFSLESYNNNNLVLSSGADGLIVMWDLSQNDLGKIIAKVPSSVYAIKYLEQEHQLLVGQNFDGLHLIDLNEGKEIKSVQLTKSYIFDIKATDSYILVAEGQGRVFLLDKETLKVLSVWDDTDKSARSIAITSDIAAVGFSDNSIRLYDIKSRKKIKEWIAHENSVFKVIFDPTGGIISSSRDAKLNFWNSNGDLEQSIVAHMYAINDICFNPEQDLLATCSMDKSIKIWDLKSRKLLKVIDKARHAGHGTSVNKLLWTSFNNYIVSCSDDRTLSVWDINKSEK